MDTKNVLESMHRRVQATHADLTNRIPGKHEIRQSVDDAVELVGECKDTALVLLDNSKTTYCSDGSGQCHAFITPPPAQSGVVRQLVDAAQKQLKLAGEQLPAINVEASDRFIQFLHNAQKLLHVAEECTTSRFD